MKFKGFVIAPIDGENCYLVDRAKGDKDSWKVKVTYHYIEGYEVNVDIPGSVDINVLLNIYTHLDNQDIGEAQSKVNNYISTS